MLVDSKFPAKEGVQKNCLFSRCWENVAERVRQAAPYKTLFEFWWARCWVNVPECARQAAKQACVANPGSKPPAATQHIVPSFLKNDLPSTRRNSIHRMLVVGECCLIGVLCWDA